MELKDWTYEEFPEFSEYVEDSNMIDTTGDELGVRYIPNVPYCTIGETTLYLQIMLPVCRNFKGSEKFPCVVFVQGSAWFAQDVYGNVPNVSALARRGFVVAIVQYRHSGIASFPAQIIDARNAVRFMKVHADEYQVDSSKVFLSGDSSGGHTAVYAGIYKDDQEDTNLFPGTSANVNAIVNYYGCSSFLRPDSNPITSNHNMPDSPEGQVMGGVNLNEHPELVEKLSIECQISEDTDIPPVLHFHGTKDRIVNTYCSVDLYRKMKACKKETYLYLIKGADHGGSEFWTETVIDIVEDFLRKHI